MSSKESKKGKKIGYARVSTKDQDLSLQLDDLKQFGVIESDIYSDVVSGAKDSRPGLDVCLEVLQSGDTLVVWRLDRLGRSMVHLVNTIQELTERGVFFKSLNDGAIDTTTASGELIFNIFSALTQFERRLIQERTNAGLKSARARGKLGGRPTLDANDPTVVMAKQMHENKALSVAQICETLGISRATYYRYIAL
ncbi:recombinase family protein [Pseudoalteromonas luteoviolacea]|uniref:recombinase family protein n=1 Tax=Pseudoalteromonas luteoviolacea TaxID=43657 RepID=UPI001154BD45|nr:recombinase family protein [Pseudoalteromonas luteoviolacea]TQF71800.1 recombinase family protein [Pseudoalteromonas luteoviolacea]